MKKISIFINSFLVAMIVLTIIYQPKVSSKKVNIVSKSITTSMLGGVDKDNNTDNNNTGIDESINNLENKLSNNITEASIITDVLETIYGTMSGYGLDCKGCSGVVGARYDAKGNNLRYYDPVYGECRIVAGDKKYPYGTIVRVKNSKIGTFNAIVLDRGSDIGIGRRYLFDLLFWTEKESYDFGLSRNTTFEILRYGY